MKISKDVRGRIVLDGSGDLLFAGMLDGYAIEVLCDGVTVCNWVVVADTESTLQEDVQKCAEWLAKRHPNG